MATVDVLFEGYISPDDGSRVASTVGLVRDGEVVVVGAPGLVPSRASILEPLAGLGIWPDQVTEVVFSHHHPDHTLNAALFPLARFHDHWAIYQGDSWTSRDAEGFRLSDGVSLIRSPGHTEEDISTLVETEHGLVAFTHMWWSADGPAEDPYAFDAAALHASRARLLGMSVRTIVPGHGAPFEPSESTPR